LIALAMWLTVFASIFAALVAFALNRAVRQFRHYQSLAPDPLVERAELPSLAIVVPVRNEERTIEPCLTGLIRQHYPADRLQLIVVDDSSSDRTAQIVRAIAEKSGLQFLHAVALPPGWAGKPYACWRGALAAKAEWLCFIDADTFAEPALLRTAIVAAQHRRLDMLSLEPFQELTGFVDRLVIPLGFLAIAATQDLASINRRDTDEATANGQFMLFRAESYFTIGGHAAVHDSICEDSALARRVKAAGLQLAVLGAEKMMRTRMYADGAELWEGLSKNVTEIFGGSARTLIGSAAALTIGWSAILLPIWSATAMASNPGPLSAAALTLAVAGSLAAFATQIATARHFRIPVWHGLLLPLSCSVGALIACNAVLCRRRRRIAWKGRVYASAGK
jgi:chlorobactene glucosyltransferase